VSSVKREGDKVGCNTHTRAHLLLSLFISLSSFHFADKENVLIEFFFKSERGSEKRRTKKKKEKSRVSVLV
jgi:hypothetical protein